MNKRGGILAYMFWIAVGAVMGGWIALKLFGCS